MKKSPRGNIKYSKGVPEKDEDSDNLSEKDDVMNDEVFSVVEIPQYKLIDVPRDGQCGVYALRLSARMLGVEDSIDRAIRKLRWQDIPKDIQWTDDGLGAIVITAGHRLIVYNDQVKTAVSYGSTTAATTIFIYFNGHKINGHYRAMQIKSNKIIKKIMVTNTLSVDARAVMDKMYELSAPPPPPKKPRTQTREEKDNESNSKFNHIYMNVEEKDNVNNIRYKQKYEKIDYEKELQGFKFEESPQWLDYRTRMLASVESALGSKSSFGSLKNIGSNSVPGYVPHVPRAKSEHRFVSPTSTIRSVSECLTEYVPRLPVDTSEYVPYSPANSSDYVAFSPASTAEYVNFSPRDSSEYVGFSPRDSSEYVGFSPASSAEYLSMSPRNSSEYETHSPVGPFGPNYKHTFPTSLSSSSGFSSLKRPPITRKVDDTTFAKPRRISKTKEVVATITRSVNSNSPLQLQPNAVIYECATDTARINPVQNIDGRPAFGSMIIRNVSISVLFVVFVSLFGYYICRLVRGQ